MSMKSLSTERSSFLGEFDRLRAASCSFEAVGDALTVNATDYGQMGFVTVGFDGHITNARELIGKLKKFTKRPGVYLSNALLVTLAYIELQENCIQHIIGDFSLFILDHLSRKVICASDYAGLRSVYYELQPDSFSFSSSLTQLIRSGRRSRKPNPAKVADFLTDSHVLEDQTLYEGIFKLPPGKILVVHPRKATIAGYWKPDASPFRVEDQKELIDQFRELFAVAVNRSTASKTGILLSGGIDSSSIAAMARRIGFMGWKADDSLHAYTLSFPNLECDESGFVRLMKKQSGLEVTSLPGDISLLHTSEQIANTLYFPSPPNGVAFDELKSTSTADGNKVLLTGVGGDEWLGGDESSWIKKLRRAVALTMPRRAHPGRWPQLNSEFVRSSGFCDQFNSQAPLYRDNQRIENILKFALSGWQLQRLELERLRDEFNGYVVRHPLYDRRIAEFALRLPPLMLLRQGVDRFILREAMRGMVPEEILRRRDKADFSHLFPKTLLYERSEKVFASLRIAEAGWVNRDVAKQMHDQLINRYREGDGGYRALTWKVWMLYGMELWYRHAILQERRS